MVQHEAELGDFAWERTKSTVGGESGCFLDGGASCVVLGSGARMP